MRTLGDERWCMSPSPLPTKEYKSVPSPIFVIVRGKSVCPVVFTFT